MMEATYDKRVLNLLQNSLLDLRRKAGMLGYMINEITVGSLLLEKLTNIKSKDERFVEEWFDFLSDINLMLRGEIELMEEYSNGTGYWLIRRKL